MFTRRFAVSVLFFLLSGCGGDEPSTPSAASGASGTGVAGTQTAAPVAGTSGLPAAAAGSSASAGAPSGLPAAGSGAIAGAPSGLPAAGTGGSAGAPSGLPAAAGSGGTTGAPASCATDKLTYSDFAAPFFASHCNRCHGQGDKVPRIQRPPTDVTFNSEADVIRSRDRIRKIAITDQRMPPGEPLTGCIAEQLSKYLDTLPAPPPAP